MSYSFKTSALDGGGWCHAPAVFTPGKDPLPIVQEAGWAPGRVWIGAENLGPPGFFFFFVKRIFINPISYTLGASLHAAKKQ